MQRQFAVYVLLHVDIEPTGRGSWLQNKSFYVGSTITGLHVRQDVRWRKHRCLDQGQFVNVELVMHYLHSRGLLHDVAILPLSNLVNATDTRSKELEIYSELATYVQSSLDQPTSPPPPPSEQPNLLFRPLVIQPNPLGFGKRFDEGCNLWVFFSFIWILLPSSQGWDILMMLAGGGRLAFEASRRLRSSEFSPMHIFALHRLSNHLDDPPRTRVKSSLLQTLKFRQLAVPNLRKPLVIPFLAHSSFKQSVRAFLRHQIRSSKEFRIPFDLPSVQVVAGKQQSMNDLLYNHLRAPRSWSWSTPPPCSCASLLLQHPELQLSQGHIASPLKKLNVSRCLRHILSFSAENTGCTIIARLHCLYINQGATLDAPEWY